MLTVAFADYAPEQSLKVTTNPTAKNLVGRFGAEVSFWSLNLVGISTWLIPAFLLWMSYVSVRNARRLANTRIIAMLLCIISLSGLAAMTDTFKGSQYFSADLGGVLGNAIYNDLLKDSLGIFGTGFLLGMTYIISLMFILTKDIGMEFEKIGNSFGEWRARRAQQRTEQAAIKRETKDAKNRQKHTTPPIAVGAPPINKLSLASRTTPPMGTGTNPPIASTKNSATTPQTTAESKANPATTPAPAPAEPTAKTTPRTSSNTRSQGTVSPYGDNAPLANTSTSPFTLKTSARIDLNIVKPQITKNAATPTLLQSPDEKYQFPPLTLLKDQIKSSATGNSEDEHRRNAENLLRILSEFGVEVSLGEIHVGPVITRYEVVPAAGVRVEKIAGLDKNIALGMRAQSVRILAPIPGKAAVGVEVPNQNSTPVGLREILESEDWVNAKAELPIALGKDVSGAPLVSDLAKMPHLLIAGATGSGKSVCINAIIASILFSKSPKDVRLLMVDPKIVELKIFNPLPHMLIPVVTEPKKVPGALKWLLAEMEQRYQIFAKVGVRNITAFNSRKKESVKAAAKAEVATQAALTGIDPSTIDDGIEVPERLPYIVAIIDELADLMMVAPAEIETSIARLAQLARAAGIHLIIATQRPSVNVITGIIKANLPSRIAFQVASQVDSRTILDTKGADTLIGRGDMLFSPPGSSRLVRAQGAYVSDDEMQSIIEALKKNGPPQYAQEVQARIDRDPETDEDDEAEDDEVGDDDDLLHEAIGVLKSTRRASTSMLQRRLRIGYNRAARIMELMEEKGIVGPENGAQPREILKDLDSL